MKKFLMMAGLALICGQAWADTGTDPDWPCIQRKQPHLSLGQVWTGPVPDEAVQALVSDPAIAGFADRLEQRRLPIADAETQIAEFAATASNDQLTALMVAVFQRLDDHRGALIQGISRYGHKQVDLARSIEDRRARMAEMERAESPDFDAIDAQEAALDWETRIFTDRQQALTYVCETPVIIEQRAFALGRVIAAAIQP